MAKTQLELDEEERRRRLGAAGEPGPAEPAIATSQTPRIMAQRPGGEYEAWTPAPAQAPTLVPKAASAAPSAAPASTFIPPADMPAKEDRPGLIFSAFRDALQKGGDPTLIGQLHTAYLNELKDQREAATHARGMEPPAPLPVQPAAPPAPQPLPIMGLDFYNSVRQSAAGEQGVPENGAGTPPTPALAAPPALGAAVGVAPGMEPVGPQPLAYGDILGINQRAAVLKKQPDDLVDFYRKTLAERGPEGIRQLGASSVLWQLHQQVQAKGIEASNPAGMTQEAAKLWGGKTLYSAGTAAMVKGEKARLTDLGKATAWADAAVPKVATAPQYRTDADRDKAIENVLARYTAAGGTPETMGPALRAAYDRKQAGQPLVDRPALDAHERTAAEKMVGTMILGRQHERYDENGEKVAGLPQYVNGAVPYRTFKEYSTAHPQATEADYYKWLHGGDKKERVTGLGPKYDDFVSRFGAYAKAIKKPWAGDKAKVEDLARGLWETALQKEGGDLWKAWVKHDDRAKKEHGEAPVTVGNEPTGPAGTPGQAPPPAAAAPLDVGKLVNGYARRIDAGEPIQNFAAEIAKLPPDLQGPAKQQLADWLRSMRRI